MGKLGRWQVLVDEGPAAFSFLVGEHGFTGPDVIASAPGSSRNNGLRYARATLYIEVTVWQWNNQTGFSTVIGTGEEYASAELSGVFVACGAGSAQAVPGSVGGVHTVRKRIAQHSDALRKVMWYLDRPDVSALLRACR